MLFKRSKHRLMRSIILSLLLYNSSLQPIAPLYAKGIMTVIASVGVLTTLFQQWFIAMFWGYQLKQEIEKEGFTLPELPIKKQFQGFCTFKRALKEFDIQDPVALFRANVDDIKRIFEELKIKDPLKFFQEKAQQIEALLQELGIPLPVDPNANPLETAKKLQHDLKISDPIAFLTDHLAIIKAGLALLDNPKKRAENIQYLKIFLKEFAQHNQSIEPFNLYPINIPRELNAFKALLTHVEIREGNPLEIATHLLVAKRMLAPPHPSRAALEIAKKRAAELEAIADAQRTNEDNQQLLKCYELLQKESDKQLALLQQEEGATKEKQTALEVAQKHEHASWQQRLGTLFYDGFCKESEQSSKLTVHTATDRHTVDPTQHIIQQQPFRAVATFSAAHPSSTYAAALTNPLGHYPIGSPSHTKPPSQTPFLPYQPQLCGTAAPSPSSTALTKAH